MRFADKTIRSIADLVKLLKPQVGPKDLIWFRGQSNAAWKLVPKLARRQKDLKAESALIKRFMQNANPHLPTAITEEWEWMFLMQHHGAYTRLLDWSESPLVALFFAVTQSPRSQGAIWCLDPIALNESANIKFSFSPEIPALGRDQVVNNYLPSHVYDSTVQLGPAAVIGPRNTPRMVAQLGTFTVNHLLHQPIEQLGSKNHVWRLIIPARAKPTIVKELAMLGYTPLTLFPELDRVADLTCELLT